MLDGINLSEELSNSQAEKQLENINSVTINSINNPYKNADKNLLIDETAISEDAMTMYQKEQDMKKFTDLAMSDPQDLSHEEIISNLFSNGVTDLFSDETFSELSENTSLLNDLEL